MLPTPTDLWNDERDSWSLGRLPALPLIFRAMTVRRFLGCCSGLDRSTRSSVRIEFFFFFVFFVSLIAPYWLLDCDCCFVDCSIDIGMVCIIFSLIRCGNWNYSKNFSVLFYECEYLQHSAEYMAIQECSFNKCNLYFAILIAINF